jgi:uncharacterized protein
LAHIDTVQKMYDAFGRGDVPAILEHLADDVQWEYGVTSTDVPWLQPRRGPAEVARFFEALSALDFHKFQPKEFLAAGHLVVVLFDLEVTVRATGKRIVEDDEVHIWYFNEGGKVARFRHRVDTHQHLMALQG